MKPDAADGWPTASVFTLGLLLGGVIVGAALWLMVWVGWWPQTPQPKAHLDPLTAAPQDYAWSEQPEPAFPLPPYARFLAGVKIVLDPGHVGQRDPGGMWKRGPTGLREAEVNLRVAQFLRQFLMAAAAEVVLTRDADKCLNLPDEEDLRQRIEVANRLRADLFLSIHHNAVPESPSANYTSVFYHAAAEDSPASAAAARAVLTGLNDALRLDTHLACAVLSDQVLYKNGLAVLRQARVPAILSEASFHSHPAEENRLRDPVYNRREAYGLFLGLARWAQAGLPRVQLAPGEASRSRAGKEWVIVLDDGLSSRGGWGSDKLPIEPDLVVVKLDGQKVPHTLDLSKRQVRVALPNRSNSGPRELFVDFENALGQHVLHPVIALDAAR